MEVSEVLTDLEKIGMIGPQQAINPSNLSVTAYVNFYVRILSCHLDENK
jgi:hypothetical protein